MDIKEFMKKSISDTRSLKNNSHKRFQKWVLFNQHVRERNRSCWYFKSSSDSVVWSS